MTVLRYSMFTSVILTIVTLIVQVDGSSQPNIVFILADDLGWDDVGYHNPDIYTPNIDRLAEAGVKLENYYVQQMCSPSRVQLLSGKYQIHTGLQHGVILSCQRNGLPLEDLTIADRLKPLGYSTHMLGKWHVGFFREEYTPLYRGFDTFFGYYGLKEYYYSHDYCDVFAGETLCGKDLRDQEKVVWNNTEYSTHMYAERAEQIIREHDAEKPLFMYLSFQAPHPPLQVPEEYEQRYSHIADSQRRTYSGMVTCMDEAIGNVTRALDEAGMADNTIIIFSTDNGANPDVGGNNWPLRGGKKTLWEGGVRGVGFVHGNMIAQKGAVNRGLIHISDWYPTLVNLAGGQVEASWELDGYDAWQSISSGGDSERTELLHAIDPIWDLKGPARSFPGSTFDVRVQAAIRRDNWKLLTGDPGESIWRPPAGTAFGSIILEDDPEKNVWLFDIERDPYEHHDVAALYPEVVEQLLARLDAYNATAVPCRWPPNDLKCAPSLHGGAWGPWV